MCNIANLALHRVSIQPLSSGANMDHSAHRTEVTRLIVHAMVHGRRTNIQSPTGKRTASDRGIDKGLPEPKP
ncbi:hypothetical protein BV22DRAFT_867135 [Leucogyrophana mollusca]|uniref:Uncharacterized protein n=1 Tax=Leucogyrophana mollusca TaxID=85980 RepID=A0ACB8B194_9AGAM|nr:hypothetical protein BV22DRAFT_867135 [Leucogyrophana mollusca]